MSGTCKTFFKKYLSKNLKEQCNKLGRRYRRLQEKAEDDESDSFHSSDEPSVIRDKISDLMEPSIKRYAKDLFKGVDVTLEDDEAFEFCEVFGHDDIEIFLIKWDEGWIPSVRTTYWDAPASTIDPGCAVKTVQDAFVWGFGDAMAYHFISEVVK